MQHKIGIIGGGAWGTALAAAAARSGAETLLWAREEEVVTAINSRHENTIFLPGAELDPAIAATADIAAACDADFLLMVAPAQHMRRVLDDMKPHIPAQAPLVLCAKGIEQETGALMTEVAQAVLPDQPLAVLSGPTFAAEVARGLPTAVTLAASDITLADRIAAALAHANFRPYANDDPIGAEIGGAVKNVLAIACGIAVGRKLGENARAALMTRGMAEILRFGAAKGGKAETLMGLAGLGDLILTCSSLQSRNMYLGAALGEGRRYQDILAERQSVAEGAHTAPVLARLAREMDVAMPIVEAVNAILREDIEIDAAMDQLLSRPLKREI